MRKMTAILCLSCLLLLCLSSCSLIDSDEKKAEQYYQLGLKAREQGKQNEAVIYFKNTVQKNPRHAKGHYQLGLLYAETSRPALALRSLTLASNIDPSFREAKKALASLYYANGSHDGALPLLNELVDTGDTSLDSLLMLGNSLLSVPNVTEAEKILRRAVEIYPDSAAAATVLSRVLLQENKIEQARSTMESASLKNPRDIQIQLLLIQFYAATGQEQEAENKIREAMSRFPDQADPFIAAADYYLSRKQPDRSVEILSSAIERKMSDPLLYQALALLKHRSGERNVALALFQKGSELFPEDQKSLIILADYYLFLQQLSKAKETYEKAVDKWPDLVPIKAKIVEILMTERHFEVAEERITKLLEENPDYAAGYILQGLLRREQGDQIKAQKSFLKAREIAPLSPEGHYYYGLSLMDERAFTLSLSELLQALEKDPASSKIRIALAYVYFKTGKNNQALDEITRVMEAEPGNLRGRLLRAEILLKDNKHSEAAADYRFISEKNPELLIAPFRLAEIDLAVGNREKAETAFMKLAESSSNPLPALQKLLSIYIFDKSYQKAHSLVDKFRKKYPDNIEIDLLKGRVFFSQRKMNEALEYLSTIVAAHPSSEKPLILIAQVQEMKNDDQAAITAYQKAIALKGKHTEARLKLARLHLKRGDVKTAIITYESLIEQDPEFGPALNDLAYLLADNDINLDRALEAATKAQKIMPGNLEVEDTLGWIYVKQGALPLAKKHLLNALEQQPDNALFNLHLAMVYYTETNAPVAKSYLKKALAAGGLTSEESRMAHTLLQNMQKSVGDKELASGEIRQLLTSDNVDKALAEALLYYEGSPGDSDGAYVIGMLYLKKGSSLLAKQYLSRATELSPMFSEYHYILGTILYKDGDKAGAQAALNIALALGLPGEKATDAKELIEKLQQK